MFDAGHIHVCEIINETLIAVIPNKYSAWDEIHHTLLGVDHVNSTPRLVSILREESLHPTQKLLLSDFNKSVYI